MDEVTRALAAEAVTLPGWRWMPGMLAAGPHGPRGGANRARVEGVFSEDGATPKVADFKGRRVPAHYAIGCEPEQVVPDFDDPATLGCLLALVREAQCDPRLVAIYCEAANPGQSEGWGVQTADNRLPIDGVGDHPTEAHALVAALRAAGHDSGHDASKGAP